ncbi:putative ankyrin repeat protein RF_0381 [Cloeon dipterum]|uniref:putative ankyrin repeat protein RF_0381 n=1 Tax=Cloeon dipterum TaxID=197152 RepID=UPI00322036D5
MNPFMSIRDIDRFSEKTASGATPLMLAARYDDLQSCLALVEEEGEDPKAITHFGVTLLHFAALNKHHGMEIIWHFLEKGPDLAASKDVDGEEPVLYAIRVGDWNLAKNILQLQSGETNLLHYFVIRNNMEMVQLVHDEDKELINKLDLNGRNALHLAAEFADLKMCEWIVEHGVTEALSSDQSTALHRAALNKEHGEELVTYFVDRKKLNYLYFKNRSNETPMHLALLAGNIHVAQQMLNLGAKLYNCSEKMLLYCVKNNNLKSAKFVHEMDGLQIKQLDTIGRNALHIAAECADLQMCQWLVEDEGFDVKALTREWNSSAIHHVGYNKLYGTQLVSFFVGLGLDLNSLDGYLDSPLHFALTDQNIEVAEEMIKYGADLRAKNGPYNLLHKSVISNFHKNVQFLHSKDPGLTRQLGKYENNALHFAAKHADKEMCRFLCDEAGIDVHASCGRDANGVLHFSVMNKYHGAELIEYFATEKQANVHQTNRFFETPLHFALKKENLIIAEALLKLGADINLKNADRGSLLHFCAYRNKLGSARFVLQKNINLINSVNCSGMTALHVAAKWANFEFCKFLVEQGIDSCAKDAFGNAALAYVPATNFKLKRGMIAAAPAATMITSSSLAGERRCVFFAFLRVVRVTSFSLCGNIMAGSLTFLRDLKWVELLGKRHADLETLQQKFRRNTNFEYKLAFIEAYKGELPALHFAAKMTDAAVCRRLVEQGADVGAKCSILGASALHYAAVNVVHGMQLAEFFVANGCSAASTDKNGDVPLVYALRARNFELAAKLHEKISPSGENLLHFCIKTNKLDFAKFVLEEEEYLIGDASCKRNYFELAVKFADLAMCKWFLQVSPLKVGNFEEESSFLKLAVNNEKHATQIIPFLLSKFNYNHERGANLISSLIIHTIDSGKFGVAEELLKHGGGATKLKVRGKNLLQYYVCKNNLDAAKFVHEKDRNLIKEVGVNGVTVLHLAVQFGSLEMCQWLLEQGQAKVNKNSFAGFVHCAVRNKQNGKEIMLKLCQNLISFDDKQEDIEAAKILLRIFRSKRRDYRPLLPWPANA